MPNLVRLLVAGVIVAAAAAAVACGGGSDKPTPVPTVSISSGDEQAIDQAIAAVIAGLQARTTAALDGLANDKLLQQVSVLDPLATCFPADGALAVRTRVIKPEIRNAVRASINFTVTQNGATTTVARDWHFELEADGSFKLTAAPDCPFKRVVPTTAATGTPAPTDTGTAPLT
jgi:hypothetical protein